MHDEAAAIAEIKELSKNAQSHLSHVVRNGLCLILAAHGQGKDVDKRIYEMEAKVKELGL